MSVVLEDSLVQENGPTPAEQWSLESARRALDDLFAVARRYRSSKAYRELLQFTARFRFYSPYNALLVYAQKPGATFVATARRWLEVYARRIKPSALPLVILQPMGPVMFVFDVSDTEPTEGAPPLPPEVEKPLEVRGGKIGSELEETIANARRDGVVVAARAAGSQDGGLIRSVMHEARLTEFVVRMKPQLDCVQVPLRYEILLNGNHSREAQYATLVHELAHLFCGHLGTPNPKWWPDRRGLSRPVQEFEAESVSYLVCARLGIDNPSGEYLAGYERAYPEVPAISLECVLKVAGSVEQMSRHRLKPRSAAKNSEGIGA